MTAPAFPEAWRPQPGESVKGTVTRIGVGDAGWGAYPILVLRVAGTLHERDVAVHAFRDVLKAELAQRQVQVGDVITVTYLGLHAKGYHGYRVEGADRAFDWSQFGGAPPAVPLAPASSAPPDDPEDIPY